MKYYIFSKKEKDQHPYLFEINQTKFCSDIEKAKRFTFDEAVKYHLNNKQYMIIQETRSYDSIDFKISAEKS